MGATKRSVILWGSLLVLSGVPWAPPGAAGAEREVAGVITEIHPGRGQIEIRSPDREVRRPATPLLTLKSGDTVITTDDAWVVVVLSGGRGGVRVDETTSPFTVTAPPAERSQLRRGLMILQASFSFLAATPKEPRLGNLATRGATMAPVILAPHNGRVLPGSLAFEWRGSRSSRYTVRILGPGGPVLERRNLAATSFGYPADAPALIPGVRYRFELHPPFRPPLEAWFELVEPDRARAIRGELADLEEALPAGLPPATRATLRAGFLAANGLLHDARRCLIAELARQPEEPTLHFLLGEVYARQRLPELASESFAEARFLTSGAPPAR
jgi:hypothetical protein